MPDNGTTTKTTGMSKVYIDRSTLKDLKRLAARDRRTLGSQVAWLIESEIARRASASASTT
jgi:hypothetical protein